MEKQMKRAKIFNYTIATIFFLGFVGIIIFLGAFKWSRTFTVSKWMENPEKRYKIVADMLSTYEFEGMTEQEIIKLLGEETKKAPEEFKYPRGSFPDDSTLAYYLGVDFMDNSWLIIRLQNGVAVGHDIGLT